MHQPRKNSKDDDPTQEMDVDIIEVDKEFLSGCTILSTHRSLKRKYTSPPNACHQISNNVTPSNNNKISKDDYHLLFPNSASDIFFAVIELDCGHPYCMLPCRVWDGNNRAVTKVKAQAKKDYKYR